MTGLTAVALIALVAGPVAFNPLRSPSAPVEEGNAKMKAGKPDEALTAYDRAVAELPADAGVHFNRGTALFALSRFEEAAEEFLRATEAKETALKAAAFYNLGNAFFKKEKFGEAVEAYRRALTLDPKDERAKWNLEIALKKKKEDDEKKENEKKKDKDKKDGQQDKDKDKKDDGQKDDKQQQDQKQDQKDQQKDQNKQDQQPKDDNKDGTKPEDKRDQAADQDKKPPGTPPSDKAAAQRELEAVLDGLEKSPKDLERERARLRAVRRAPPARDW